MWGIQRMKNFLEITQHHFFFSDPIVCFLKTTKQLFFKNWSPYCLTETQLHYFTQKITYIVSIINIVKIIPNKRKKSSLFICNHFQFQKIIFFSNSNSNIWNMLQNPISNMFSLKFDPLFFVGIGPIPIPGIRSVSSLINIQSSQSTWTLFKNNHKSNTKHKQKNTPKIQWTLNLQGQVVVEEVAL